MLTERDGYLFGRGANDMKGGIAGLVIALEALHRQGVRLAGDVVFCTVTDEESSGAGGRAAVAHGVRADAGIAAEATDFDAWVSCRGTVTPTITVAGRAGHAEMPQPDWRDGGAVNAIEKLVAVLNGDGRAARGVEGAPRPPAPAARARATSSRRSSTAAPGW